ncbi:hypothetical protein [Prosthecobacter fluviatilis]|uniref:Uncharacterized protein n=1 Tax=Prosthecobacter fluviatilis TaxID=445931 RepID=A0ABW0KQ00_9BACT
MRWWLLLLGVTTCCPAQPLPVIPLGTTPREVEVYDDSRRQAFLTSASAMVTGVVISSSSEVHQSPTEILLEETCLLQIETMNGTLSGLAGATTLRLGTSYEHDKYLQLEPDWGTYRLLSKGQKVVALLNEEEGQPEIRRQGLVVLNEKTRALPDILRRTGLDASCFTAADLAILKEASPLFHEEVVTVAGAMADIRSDHAACLNKLVGVCVAAFFAIILCADHFRSRFTARCI